MTWTKTRGGQVAWIVAAALGVPWTMSAAWAAGRDDRAATQTLLDELGRDAKHRAVIADSVARAADALERGRRMRVAGDAAHAAAAEALAGQWVETARALVRAADIETQANELHRKALAADGQVAKTRELVEEVIARTGRLRAQIAAAEHDPGPGKTAVETHAGDRAATKGHRPAPSPASAPDGGAP